MLYLHCTALVVHWVILCLPATHEWHLQHAKWCPTVMMWLAVTLCSSGTNLSFRKRAMGQRSVFATSKAAILSYAKAHKRQKIWNNARNNPV